MTKNLPALLVVMDGFGMAAASRGNAIAAADTPNLDALFSAWPWTTLQASGLAVGLPEGQMGNSEVGHLNIGAGRVVYQELTRINLAVSDRSLFSNPVLAEAIDGAVAEGRAVHFMGLLSDGGVHSSREHLYALLEMARERGAERVYVHAFLDGRDVPPESGLGFVEDAETFMAELGTGEIATVMGRYYAMDRDNRWDRVERAWQAMVLGDGRLGRQRAQPRSAPPTTHGVTDEFVCPRSWRRVALSDGDAVIFFNFRPDRAREITRAFTDPTFEGFDRPVFPQLRFVCLTAVRSDDSGSGRLSQGVPRARARRRPRRERPDPASHRRDREVRARDVLLQRRCRDAQGGRDRGCSCPSPKVPTYDQQPAMSAPEVTRQLVEAIESDAADVYIVNFANCDMVGHTGRVPGGGRGRRGRRRRRGRGRLGDSRARRRGASSPPTTATPSRWSTPTGRRPSRRTRSIRCRCWWSPTA